MNETYEKLVPYMDKFNALNAALTLFSWDNETLAPKQGIDHTAQIIGILSQECFQTLINDEVKELIKTLSIPDMFQTLDTKEQAIVKDLKKQYDQMESIPVKEYAAYNELTAKSISIWANAKNANDYSKFTPTLEKLVNFQKSFAGYRKKEGQLLYDVLLNDNEEGFSTKELDVFFTKIRSAIVPLLKKVVAKNDAIDKSYNFKSYDLAKQKEFNRYLAEYIGFDFTRGVMAESEHPFTTELHNHDVRITTHYYEHNLESSLFSVIHETGHALYEMNIDDSLALTCVGHGTSMGMHESQSRFYENIVGRSKSFWLPLWDRLVALFPENLSDVTLDQFIACINKAEPSLIRTEADELTYSLHIMIRYEIEKALFAGEVTVDELDHLWNQKYEEYLGITPKDAATGILQDMHWAGGSFGYFPSYALGNAIAAQIYSYMKKTMPFDEYLMKGDFTPIIEFLKEHIHKYGATKNTNELLIAMTGEPLNADYFVSYLTEKYTKLYQL